MQSNGLIFLSISIKMSTNVVNHQHHVLINVQTPSDLINVAVQEASLAMGNTIAQVHRAED
jgi:hypothetical protein